MSLAKQHAKKPLAGARIMGSLHDDSDRRLIETVELGADVPGLVQHLSTQDHAAAAVAVAARECETVANPGARRCSRGRAKHSTNTGGARAGARVLTAAPDADRRRWARRTRWCTKASSSSVSGVVPAFDADKDPEGGVIPETIRRSIGGDKAHAHRLVAARRLEEMTTGVHRLYQMMEAGTQGSSAINVNDPVTRASSTTPRLPPLGCRTACTRDRRRGAAVAVVWASGAAWCAGCAARSKVIVNRST
jgi:adenosylhomocysteinase